MHERVLPPLGLDGVEARQEVGVALHDPDRLDRSVAAVAQGLEVRAMRPEGPGRLRRRRGAFPAARAVQEAERPSNAGGDRDRQGAQPVMDAHEVLIAWHQLEYEDRKLGV